MEPLNQKIEKVTSLNVKWFQNDRNKVIIDVNLFKRLVNNGNTSVNTKYNNGLTALHIAVENKNMDLFNYIIEYPDTDLNSVNEDDETPLLLAVKNEDCNIAHKLIEKGADLNACNNELNSALHVAVKKSDSEMVHMLLYYGADANKENKNGMTPFMLSLRTIYIYGIQESLLEYETDFNRVCSESYRYETSTLMLAICNLSPLVREIVERGADVNDEEMEVAWDASFDEGTLRVMRYRYKFGIKDDSYELLNGFVLSHYRNILDNDLLEFYSRIFYSDKVDEIIQNYEGKDLLYCLIWKSHQSGLSESNLFPFVCVCLSWGAKVYLSDVIQVYNLYGYHETLKLFLHIGVEIDDSPDSTILRIACDVNKDASPQKYVETVCMYLSTDYADYVQLIEKRLLETSVPSLKELSREMCRKTIRTQFQISSSSLFYSVLNHLPIPELVKKIIAYEVPLYEKR